MAAGTVSPRQQERFSAAMLLPVIVSLLIAVAAVLGFIFWSARNSDAGSMERQLNLARHVIARELQLVPRQQEAVTVWDDAIYRTRLNFDVAWIDRNLGVRMHEHDGHDGALIVNERNEPVYGMRAGKRVDHNAFGKSLLPQVRPLIERLRGDIEAGAIDKYRNGRVMHPPRAVQLMSINGIPSIVSVVPIISDSAAISQAPGSEYLHIALVHLDPNFAARVSDTYQIPNASFGRDFRDTQAVLPVTDAAGRIITFMRWTPQLPGRGILDQTLPVVAAALLLGAIVTLILSCKLWSKSQALERGRADAEYRAAHDALTGMPNRNTFEALLLRTLAQRPSRDRRASILMLDLDRFKQVNDTLGHRAGDELIRAVGQRLSQLTGPQDDIARLGGDEFAIIHIHSPGLNGPLDLSNRIIDAIGKPFVIFGSEAFVGVSIGIATAEGGEVDAHELTRKADIALYEAKATGRNRAVVFEESMNEFLQNRKTIEAELREALRNPGQLAVAFQPLYNGNREPVGAEALIRWTHPRLGMISPAMFVPVAEATELILPLGDFVLGAACSMGAQWPGRTFAVNISPAQLRDPGFPARVFATLAETGMRSEDLELEITEGILLEDTSIATEAIRLFRSAGIKVALDDFGTGYSSLNYLKRYPVDRIKIDRSFVSQLAPGSVSVAIVQAMVTLAHALDIDVTAEGVETAEQMQVLSELGCNIYQGYLLSTPLTPIMLERVLSEPQSRVA